MNPWLWLALIAARGGNGEAVPIWGARIVGGLLLLSGALIGGAMLFLILAVTFGI